MTVSEDLNFVEEGGEVEAGSTAYPTAFGITLTPTVSGVLVAVLGLAGALYLLLNLVMPAWENYQKLQADKETKQNQVVEKQEQLKQIAKVKADLAQAKQQNGEVLALFANETTLDTLLLDINQQVEKSNARLQPNQVRAKLKKFLPQTQQGGEVVADGSLGAEVNGKLKRRVVNVEMEGTYEQTQAILRNIERLQPLLIVKDYQSTLAPVPPPDPTGKQRVFGPAAITTSFQLQALVPANPEEVKAATAQPK